MMCTVNTQSWNYRQGSIEGEEILTFEEKDAIIDFSRNDA